MSAVHFRKSQNGQLRQLKTQAEHGGSPGAKMAMNGPPAGPFEPIFRWDGDRPSRRVSISYVGPFASISVLFFCQHFGPDPGAQTAFTYIFFLPWWWLPALASVS